MENPTLAIRKNAGFRHFWISFTFQTTINDRDRFLSNQNHNLFMNFLNQIEYVAQTKPPTGVCMWTLESGGTVQPM